MPTYVKLGRQWGECMTPSEELYETLRKSKLDFFVSVPGKLLAKLIAKVEHDVDVVHSPVSREEEAVGMACGAYLAGRRPAVVMQNSGFGNSANAILSLLNYYQIPVVFVVSHRGSSGEPIAAQRMMGAVVVDLLKVIGVDALTISTPTMLSLIKPAIDKAYHASNSLAILLPFSFWVDVIEGRSCDVTKRYRNNESDHKRAGDMQSRLSCTRTVLRAGPATEFLHARVYGASYKHWPWPCTVSARQSSGYRWRCIGNHEVSGFATIGYTRPNLVQIIIDNSANGSTGFQP